MLNNVVQKTLLAVGLVLTMVSVAIALQATVTWVDMSGDETGFRVERRDGVDANPWNVQTTTAPNITSYNQPGLTLVTRYCYRVVAFSGFGDSAPNIEVCGTPDKPLPASGVSLVFAP